MWTRNCIHSCGMLLIRTVEGRAGQLCFISMSSCFRGGVGLLGSWEIYQVLNDGSVVDVSFDVLLQLTMEGEQASLTSLLVAVLTLVACTSL